MSKKTRLILIIIGAVLAVAIVTGGIIAISNAVKKNKQSKCEHEYGDVVVVTEATCETKGLTLQICTLCEYELTEEIPAFGHTEYVINAKPATCLESGLSDGITCITCNKTIVPQVTIPALGHNVVTDNARAATCVTYGLTQGSHCKRCNFVTKAQDKIPAKGHVIVERQGYPATCETTGLTTGSYCKNCNTVYTEQEEIDATGHNFIDGTCSNCGIGEKSLPEDLSQADTTLATEVPVEIGEKVVGNWYRVYKDKEGLYPNCFRVSSCSEFGIGARVDHEGVLSCPKVSQGDVDTYGFTTFYDYGDYVDIYITEGSYGLGIGPYNPESVDGDGNGYYDFEITESSVITYIEGPSKVFRLVFDN